MTSKHFILRYLLGFVIAFTLPSIVKTDSSNAKECFLCGDGQIIESGKVLRVLNLYSLEPENTDQSIGEIHNTGSLIPLEQNSYYVPFLESIVDSRFKLLAANFQGQIDVLKTEVVRLENSKTSNMKNMKVEHGIQKRQTDTSKLERPINFQNINSSCIFFYPDYPDHSNNNKFSSTSSTNQILNDYNTVKIRSKRHICENSQFCTFLHPDHPNVASKNDKNLNNNSPTVSNENLQDAKNVNELPITSSTTDYPKTDRKMNENAQTIISQISQDHTKVKGMPTSCMDLQLLGHKLNGLYLIKTSRPEGVKIEAVFCDFQSPLAVSVPRNLIGSVKITTNNTFFYVQRHNSFFPANAVILWQLERLNEGGAFNMTTGVFTAPVPGIYHFEFHGVKNSQSYYLDVLLQLNGNTYASASTNRGNSTGSFDNLSLSVSLRLKANDRVNMFNWKNPLPFPPGVLFDIAHLHVTHFTGWLLEEDLM